jgi:hypothetical protein
MLGRGEMLGDSFFLVENTAAARELEPSEIDHNKQTQSASRRYRKIGTPSKLTRF